MPSTVEDKKSTWLTNNVNFAQLLTAVAGVLMIFVMLFLTFKVDITSNEKRLTAIEVSIENGKRRNDEQNMEIDKLRNIAATNQQAIASINAKLDFIIQRQDAVIHALQPKL